jgi:hypothetical protein
MHYFWASIWVMIPLAFFGTRIFQSWLKFKTKQVEVTSRETAEKAAQYAAKTERLEARVAVLERIITDRSTVLADEIEKLRDAPLN